MTPNLVNLRISVAPRLELRIARRWLYWKPAVTRHCRKQFPMLAMDDILPKLRAEHRSRLVACISQRIAWRIITDRNLDDPTATRENFLLQQRLAKERKSAYNPRTRSQQSIERH